MAVNKERLIGHALDLIKPDAERFIESNLDKLLEIPLIRELFNINPGLMVRLLSLGIGSIPETMRQHWLAKYAIDLAETIPREIGKLLEAEAPKGGAAVGVNPAQHMAQAAKAKKKGKSAGPAGTPEGILSLLDKKFFGKVTDFMQWFAKLNAQEKKKVQTYIFTLEPERLKVFMGVRPKERLQMLKEISVPQKEAEKDIGFFSIFATRAAKHAKRKRPPKQEKTYGLFARFAYAIGGDPVDNKGRRR